MNEEKWKIFHFETNCSFGTARNRKEWKELKSNFVECSGELDLKKMKIAPDRTISGVDSFGLYSEHTGSYTLQDFSDEHGLNL